MKQTPYDILITLKKTVDGMVESMDRRVRALASALEILGKLGEQNDKRIARLERVALLVLAAEDPSYLAEQREALANEIFTSVDENLRQRNAMLAALRGGT